MSFGEEDHRVIFITWSRGCLLSAWLVTLDTDFDRLAEVTLDRRDFTPCEVILFPSFKKTVIFGKMSLTGKLYFTFYRYRLFEILSGKDCLFSPTLFIQSSVYNLMNIYFVLWAIIQYYFIYLVAQMKFRLRPPRMFPWLLPPFDMPYCSSFQSHVLRFWYYKMLQIFLESFLP